MFVDPMPNPHSTRGAFIEPPEGDPYRST